METVLPQLARVTLIIVFWNVGEGTCWTPALQFQPSPLAMKRIEEELKTTCEQQQRLEIREPSWLAIALLLKEPDVDVKTSSFGRSKKSK